MVCRWQSTGSSDGPFSCPSLEKWRWSGDGPAGGFLDSLETRVVAPVLPLERIGRPFVRLSPVLDIDGRAYVVVIPSLSSVPRQLIGDPVADFSVLRDELIAATDFLFQGF